RSSTESAAAERPPLASARASRSASKRPARPERPTPPGQLPAVRAAPAPPRWTPALALLPASSVAGLVLLGPPAAAPTPRQVSRPPVLLRAASQHPRAPNPPW